MTKRKAMLMAAGVVIALLGGSVALALGLSGGTSAVAETPKKLDPIVRTVHRTVKVEKPAKGSSEQVRVVEVGATSPSQTGDVLAAGSEDESFESEDHETEDHSTEDHEEHAEDSGDD